MRMSRLTLLVPCACGLPAQEVKFSTGVDLVTLLASVRDAQGLLAKNLTGDDFVLQQDGVPQAIRYFSRESDLPLTIGLLVDTSNSQLHVLEPERRASYTFLDQVVREDRDEAFVAHFDVAVKVLQGFTSSRKDLAAALGELEVPSHFGTLLYDAIRDCSENQMRKRMGRKAFILLSDGGDHRSKTSLGTAIEYAQRADTIVYSILFAEPPSPSRPFRSAILSMDRARGRKVMRRLAAETGGAFFEVGKGQSIEKIYAQIEETLRNQYSLGFTPEPMSAAGQYHKIKLTAKRPGLIVQTRDGYYSK
jgi:VWFA-related protein